MIKKLSILFLIAITANSAFAAQQKQKQKIRVVRSSATSTATTPARPTVNVNEGFKFEARPGIGTVNSTFSYGVSVEGKYGFDVGHGNTIFAGLESGFYHNSSSVNQFVSIYGNMIPIQGTGSFEYPVNHNLRISGGLSLGVAIDTAGANIDQTAFPNQNIPSKTNGDFIWSFRPGVILNDTFVATLPLGTVGGSFYFLPSIGARF